MSTDKNIELRELIQQMLETIVVCELEQENVNLSDAGYINQRTLISSLFKGEYNRGQIILRLTVIDSLYSTNAAYSYFSFEEMADKIYALGGNEASPVAKQKAVRDYFYLIAKGGKDDRGLFGEPYGFQKNLSEGSRQMSLLSKYAFYELLQDKESYPLGFPIYDRLAKEAYPLVRKMLGEKSYYSMPQSDSLSIEQYIACLAQLRTALFDDEKLFMPKGAKHAFQQYDILDAYLWRMGKFSDGNLSLLLGREDYAKFIGNLGLDAPFGDDGKTRKEDENYKQRVKTEFERYYPPKEGKSGFDFNKLILAHLLTDSKPFANLGLEKYLDALLTHWRVFEGYRNVAPKREISFPAKK